MTVERRSGLIAEYFLEYINHSFRRVHYTQPEIILDTDGMNLVEVNIDKADNIQDVRDAFS